MNASAINGVYAREIMNTVRESLGCDKGEAINRTYSSLSPEAEMTIKADEQSAGSVLFTPKLMQPSKEKLTHLGKLIETIGYLGNLYQDISRSEFEQRLNVIKIEQMTREASVDRALQEIDAEISLYQYVLEQLESLLSECDNVLANLGLFENELSEIRQRLKNLSPDDPDYPLLISREADLVMFSEQAKKNVEYLQARIAVTSGMATEYATNIDEHLTRVEALSSRPLQNTQYMSSLEKSAENTKSLVYLMTLIQGILQKSGEYDIKANNELNNKIFKQMQLRMEEKARDYEEQLARANRMSNAFRWIMKVLGFFMAGLTAAITGGVALIVSAAVVIIMTADVIWEASTGKSFLDHGMNVVMDATLTPLIEQLSEKIHMQMIKDGFSDSASSITSQILSMLTVFAAVATAAVATYFGGGAVAGWLGPKLSASLGESALCQCISRAVSSVGTSLSKGSQLLTHLITKIPLESCKTVTVESLQLFIKRMITWSLYTQTALTGANGLGATYFSYVTGILSAQTQQQQITLENAMKMLNDAAASRLTASNDMIADLQNALVTMLERSRKTSNQIYHNISLKA